MQFKVIDYGYNKLPKREHHNDAGLDCYALDDIILKPFQSEDLDVEQIKKDGLSIPEVLNDSELITTYTKQNTTYTIPLGFGINLYEDCVGYIRGRSSMNKKGILTQEGTVDAGYTGEIKVVLINLNNKPYHIKKGDKICQLVIQHYIPAELVTDFDNNERGSGGFGSSGR